MEIKEKILITIIWALSVFVLIKIMRFINRNLKNNLLESNPKLVATSDWFFSEKKNKVVGYFIIGGTIVFILMVWMNKVEQLK